MLRWRFRDLLRANARSGTSNLRRISIKSQQPPGNKLIYGDELFNFTRGRFVCHEDTELAQRHVRFEVEELAQIAAQSIGADSCVSIEKYPDGMYNKAMLLTMNNGLQVVARVPNPNAGRKHFATASEVATMEFVRTVLKTPVPRVLAWSSQADDNPVGAEYIIMEKVQGVELERVWPSLEFKDKWKIVQSLAKYQQAWSAISFNGFGSLYFTKDLERKHLGQPLYRDMEGNPVTNELFAIGPSVGREMFDDGRKGFDFDQGPWSSLEDYHTALGQRETTCVQQIARLPDSPISLRGPGTYQTTKKRKLEALDCYTKLLPFLLPPPDSPLQTSHLWHGDLHEGNIMVNPDQPTEIVGIIDWQSTELAPLYFHGKPPSLLDYDGPRVSGLQQPSGPGPHKSQKVFFAQSLCVLYNNWIHHKNTRLQAALDFQDTTAFNLLLFARNILIDGEITYLAQAAELEQTWHETFPAAHVSTCPVSFSEAQRLQLEEDLASTQRATHLMREVRASMGELFPDKGLVPAHLYEEALTVLEQVKEQVIEEYAQSEEEAEIWKRDWPFGR